MRKAFTMEITRFQAKKNGAIPAGITPFSGLSYVFLDISVLQLRKNHFPLHSQYITAMPYVKKNRLKSMTCV